MNNKEFTGLLKSLRATIQLMLEDGVSSNVSSGGNFL